MSAIILFLLIVRLTLSLSPHSAKTANPQTIKDADFEITYEPNGRQLHIGSLNEEKCNNYSYYINEQCEIIHFLEKMDDKNALLCKNKNKCEYLTNYVFQSLGIQSVQEEDFSNFTTPLNAEIEKKEKCNKEVQLNENIKCMCCIKEIENSETKKINEELTPGQAATIDKYPFSDCKCILKYEVDDEHALSADKCKNFICNNGICTLRMDGEPLCSCEENHYFDKNVDACVRHQDGVNGGTSQVSQAAMDEPRLVTYENDSNGNEIYDDHKQGDHAQRINDIQDDNSDTHSHHASGSQNNEESRNPSNVLTDECPINHIRNIQGECQRRESNSAENICLRIECFVNSNPPLCACVDKDGQKIDEVIFDVSHITMCTLNNINCDNGTCNNSPKKGELACICNKKYKYNRSLKVCIGYATTHLLSWVLIIALFGIIANAL
ncbi:conserved Plasmodium protein, unknown function [Plasmodium knowlesi strain H]|uniref:Merozoite surface protein 10 n=3 Tax=Plasmodium knowlesi TaxID=5850 RepID=A0A5K1UXE4_PLAKH|nr:conserved Plasmodium protein, unknown function [Plasmodium knowlesi strain H]OTN65944.1 Uncharacterized protein PKNOH_S100028900 [Plasmodium knowlesi]CAA9987654.1 conserved Plasmodium protein, unknown function [Plasmodium knowlesi strain H]SBO26866.1 conserved Plasmodium protein, unknown function [Plasmodium knowlesi strain H]SBO29668.1 conserved Plasmodium protein, unknown function [Plasmodium knowlesi strain H]VVS77128.1 conserved Plasmodium protein, unknown function [Plasmodium knowlesi |eukprot:XP_002258651.1 hypothetical protein, conserved in Plasmodium species [Plasmodium knowlesi strain H]